MAPWRQGGGTLSARALSAVLALAVISCVLAAPWPLAAGPGPVSGAMPEHSLMDAIPGAFTGNMGQLDGDFLFYTPHAAFSAGSVTLGTAARGRISISFPGSNPVRPEGLEPAGWPTSFFMGPDAGEWLTGVPSYGAVIYRELWNGTDLVYRMTPEGMKYDIFLAPGADHRAVTFEAAGHEALRLDDSGALHIATASGHEFTDSAPVAYHADGQGGSIPARFVLVGDSIYGFELEGRDISRAAVIDPLVYSTYLGGAGSDRANAVAVDAGGNAYVTGTTDLPRFSAPAGYQEPHESLNDVFVAKLGPDGTTVLYMAFLGGAGHDSGKGIAVDAEGCAYITGDTFSQGFPVTPGALDVTYNGVGDAFVTKLAPDGSSLLYSTFLGGAHDDSAAGIAVDDRGQAHVAGHTWSTTFPATQGAYARESAGDSDAFVAKLSNDGNYLIYCTYLGGQGSDAATALALDSRGNAFVAGNTISPDFPNTAGLNLTGGQGDVFVAKLSLSGAELEYSSVLGGSGLDLAFGVALDGSGGAHVTGSTASPDFPVTADSPGTPGSGVSNIFVASLSPSGAELAHSVCLGGSGDDAGAGIAVDSHGNILLAGVSASPDFPITPGALDRIMAGGSDAVMARVDPSGGGLAYSTFLGGSGQDAGTGMAISATGTAFVSGFTSSVDFPVTHGSPWPAWSGGTDGFLAKLDIIAPVAVAGQDRAVNESNPVIFNGSGSYDNEAIVNHTWTFHDGISDVVLHGEAAEHFFKVPGRYPVTLEVADAVGNTGLDTFNLEVLVYPYPVAVAGPDITVEEGTGARFNGTASRDNVGIAEFSWSFPDGLNNASVTGPEPEWIFRVPGTYTVTLNVMDTDGNLDTDTVNVTVLDTQAPRVVTGPAAAVEPGTAVALDGSASTDNVGITNHTWRFTHNGTDVVLHGENVTFIFWEPGDHRVTLDVTDAAGNRDTSDLLVRVSDSGGSLSPADMAALLLLALGAALLLLAIARLRRGGEAP